MDPKTRKRASGRTSDIPWSLDPESRQALKETVENVDPNYVDLITEKIAKRLSGNMPVGRQGRTMPVHNVRPSIGSEMGGMGFDLVSWIRQHPYKAIALVLGLTGGAFVFVRGVDYTFGKK